MPCNYLPEHTLVHLQRASLCYPCVLQARELDGSILPWSDNCFIQSGVNQLNRQLNRKEFEDSGIPSYETGTGRSLQGIVHLIKGRNWIGSPGIGYMCDFVIITIKLLVLPRAAVATVIHL